MTVKRRLAEDPLKEPPSKSRVVSLSSARRLPDRRVLSLKEEELILVSGASLEMASAGAAVPTWPSLSIATQPPPKCILGS
ncbi:Hypothetical predicted protein [Marmota monax]|uniref:Uncharacterized protein n=2 Tax=Marmota monax TaxID=9995 RepID=A0A5E4BIB7_MARMO|nr:hypothetical protein GHT09_006056 [Marmota monax]KAF7464690.1 hypothetical protein GHT09_006056 [Marmota monax]VTJ69318.1 Hypothetical predicted protein [Marmota monax]